MMSNVTYKKFDDCIESVKYTTKLQSKDFLPEGKYPIISQEEDLISGYWNNDNDVFHAPRPLVIFGDHTRVLKYVDFDFVLGADGVKILLPTEDIMAKYLLYYLKWYNIPSLGYSRHFKLLRDISVPVPSLEDQQRIVRELDTIHAILDAKNEQLRELDKLAQAIFYHMFGDPLINEMGWDVKKIGEVGQVITGSTPATKDPLNYASKDICFYKPSDFETSSCSKLPSAEYYISQYAYERSRKLSKGSVLTTCIGIIGKVGILNEDATCNQQINAIVPNEEIISSWYLGYTILLLKPLLEAAANAPVVPLLNKTQFSYITLPLPPLDLQQAFASKITAIEQQKELIRASIAETEALLAARMQYYFD